MPSHSKVTEDLRKQVVQMKSGGLSLSAIERDVGRSKSVISTILKLHYDTNAFKSTKNAGCPHKTKPREDLMNQILAMETDRSTQQLEYLDKSSCRTFSSDSWEAEYDDIFYFNLFLKKSLFWVFIPTVKVCTMSLLTPCSLCILYI